MENILNFFDNLNEYVYATDMETHDIIYMNRKALGHFGYASVDELKGKKCYEVLQGSSKPCAVCTNGNLDIGQFKEWQYYSPRFGKRMSQKDTCIELDGRRVKVEIILEPFYEPVKEPTQGFVNEAVGGKAGRQAHKQVQGHDGGLDNGIVQNLEAMVNEGLRIALMADTPDKSLMIELEYIGKLLNGERTYIFEKRENGCDDNTYEWTAAGVTPEIDNLQNLPPEVCANWYNSFGGNKSIVIKDLEDIKESDPLQYENLKRQNIHSLTVVPLYENGRAIGFYGVDNPPPDNIKYAAGVLQIMGHFITATLKRRNLIKELERMSYVDQLTTLGNRHALQAFVDEKMGGFGGIGVLYCDITGLKMVNDNKGHSAGDRYILDACDCLKEVFESYDIFRIGGDELLVLCGEITEEVFNEHIALLRKKLEEKSVIMALGGIYKTGGNFSLDDLLKRSEMIMYKDKAEYYQRSGIERRRR